MNKKLKRKIILTGLNPSDKPTLVKLLNDKEIYNNTLKIPYPYTEEHANEFLEYIRESQEKIRLQTHWAIRFKGGKGLLGVIGVEQPEARNPHRTEIGYWLGEEFRSKGIMTEAICTLTNQLFLENQLLQRIQATVYEHNPASSKVLEKAGFIFEGILKDYVVKDGQYLSVRMYAITRR